MAFVVLTDRTHVPARGFYAAPQRGARLIHVHAESLRHSTPLLVHVLGLRRDLDVRVVPGARDARHLLSGMRRRRHRLARASRRRARPRPARVNGRHDAHCRIIEAGRRRLRRRQRGHDSRAGHAATTCPGLDRFTNPRSAEARGAPPVGCIVAMFIRVVHLPTRDRGAGLLSGSTGAGGADALRRLVLMAVSGRQHLRTGPEARPVVDVASSGDRRGTLYPAHLRSKGAPALRSGQRDRADGSHS